MFRAIAFCFALGVAPCFAAESAQLDTGGSYWIHYRTGATTKVHAPMSEPNAGTGEFYVSDATLISNGLTVDCRSTVFASGYPFVITTHATSSANPVWGGDTDWDGDSVRTVATQASVDDLNPSTPLPISQVYVPASRTWLLLRSGQSIVGDRKIAMKVGETLPFAFDCRKELATNGNLTDFDSLAIKTGTSGGVTFGTLGFDRMQGIAPITAVTAGTYVLTPTLTSDDSDGIATIKGDVTLVVTP